MTNPGTTLEPGNIVLIPFPFSDLSSTKKRPVLVLTAPDRHSDFIAADITSVEQKTGAVALETAHLLRGRLPKKSWIRTDKLFTLSSEIVVKNFGAIRPDAFKQVMQAICGTIGCPPR
ncbi:MAG: type II toxin-antitoxin system PemK/MazF family toxin [Pseudomonadota bacterium]